VKGKRNFMRRVEALAKGVDGARSNVAKDDAERSENEAAVTGWGIPVFFNRLLGHAAFLERRLIFSLKTRSHNDRCGHHWPLCVPLDRYRL
jgi:hypothetical protein